MARKAKENHEKPRLSVKNAVPEDVLGIHNEKTDYMASLQDVDLIERVRCEIKDAHVFKLPPRPTSGGWRGGDWRNEVWQGTVLMFYLLIFIPPFIILFHIISELFNASLTNFSCPI